MGGTLDRNSGSALVALAHPVEVVAPQFTTALTLAEPLSALDTMP